MLHLGDITKINGAQAPVVDCVIGGSPCQDLSVAGKRAGLAGERSGLFMEQIRIIKEMREADALRRRSDDDVRPRYMVWENVPGAFSSNGGKDFAAVLEETVRIIEPEAPAVPVPEKGWPTSGCLMGDKWSVAWRVLDAQFWGVPQRRRRIALVADFGGLSAPEILFVRKSVSGDLEPGEPKRKEAAGGVGGSAENSIPYTLKIRGGCSGGGKGALIQNDLSATLSTLQDQTLFQPVAYGIDQQGGKGGANYAVDVMPTICGDSHGTPHAVAYHGAFGFDMYNQEPTGDISRTLKTPVGGDDLPVVCYDARGNGDGSTVSTITGDHNNRVTDYTSLVCYGIGNGQANQSYSEEVVGALNCMHDQQAVFCQDIAHTLKAKANCDYREDSETYVVSGLDCRNGKENGDLCGTLQSKPNGGFSLNCIHPVRVNHTVRRLTPLECERLQGYPDGWTDIGEWLDSKGKLHKPADSPRYKALGNSIAIPPWKWLLKRLCACYERDATMASLFDGIGGFPYIWEQLNGNGSCLWASEIDEFPMAVTKVRFGDDNS